jgi:hypothetical protein
MKLSNSTRGAAVVLAATAIAGLLAVPGTARAAVAGTGTTASMTFLSATVTAGTQPQVTFITSDAPAGAVVYMQEEGAGQPWRSIGRIRALSGTVDVPADEAGTYEYRILVASNAGTAIVTSAPVALTVTSADGSAPQASAAALASPAPSAPVGGGACTACSIANHALPWLTLIADSSSVWETITSILSTIGSAILAFFGF